MADFNATFIPRNDCALLNMGGVSVLCDCCQTHHNSLKRLHKDVKRRAKHSHTAGLCCRSRRHARNVLTCRR